LVKGIQEFAIPEINQNEVKMKTKHLLALGSVIPVIFWGTLTVCGYVMGDYNHLTRLVSELGAMGTRTQYMFTAGLLACAVLSVLFVIGLCQACKKMNISMIPALIILSFSLSIGGAAIFPLPLRMHLIMGMPSVLLLLSPLAALIFWRGGETTGRIAGLGDREFGDHAAGLPCLHARCAGRFPGIEAAFFSSRLVDLVYWLEPGFSPLCKRLRWWRIGDINIQVPTEPVY
jgi:hypothetical protein